MKGFSIILGIDRQKSSHDQKSTIAIVMAAVIFGVCCYLAGAMLIRERLTSATWKDRAVELASEGIHIVMSTRYENIIRNEFPDDDVDIDKNGRSLFEKRTYNIQQNSPFPGLKTVTVSVSWPKGFDQVGGSNIHAVACEIVPLMVILHGQDNG
ncbi:hypothetical protein JW979_16530 [bacterium]|nr:hypothetical protein [candidate division CSSED10-310 bacterium]